LSKKISIREVAFQAGVSISTVSLVLNGKGRISENTKKKVKHAAVTLGFILDHGASKMRSGKSSLFGVIVNNFSSPFFAKLSASLETEAFSNGYLTVIANSYDNINRQSELIASMVGSGVGGFIICPAAGSTSGSFSLIQDLSLPYVICARDIQDDNADYVGIDNYQCGVLACKHLFDLGHRKMSVVGGPEDLVLTNQRLLGFRETLESQGFELQKELTLPGPPTLDFGIKIAKHLIQSSLNFTAIFCYNDIVAYGVYAALRQSRKVIGQDISVVGVNNSLESSIAFPKLTTIEIYPQSIGQRSVKALINAIKTKNHHKEKIILPIELIVRDSTKKNQNPPYISSSKTIRSSKSMSNIIKTNYKILN
jgi:LacI family transcriptional regulator